MKIRLKFEKGRSVMFISHLDVIRVFERAFRRANLPISYTKGFNPRPKMTFTPALPVGTTSCSEYMDCEFDEEILPRDVMIRLNNVLPIGIKILEAEVADNKLPLSSLNAASYVVSIEDGSNNEAKLRNAIKEVENSKEIFIEKQSKSGAKQVNIIPLIYSIEVLESNSEGIKILMKLSIGQEGSISPSVIISVLERIAGFEFEINYIFRREIYYFDGNKKIFPI
ncbi:TIGR03936 family radical SAM-associated protein [Tepidanaerobacter syntrophicus]|nr:TIGR03936 family radical SAM-associated protein [Tepidanaerobacter syntrophicus]GLI19684.1 radical SAM protein [Tepidanaerobacter syntrophicus]HHV83312.1 DUF2344 domain-containing protein [Tepidanaerobacter syntrophicus]